MASKATVGIISGALVVVVALVAVSVWYQSPHDSMPRNDIPTPVENTFTVRYDGFSFKPDKIKVSKGTEVYFVNASNQERPMYVASDDHPTHEKYPGFDTAAVNGNFPAPGESFSFVFEKTGSWDYHDHNYSSARGVIIVE